MAGGSAPAVGVTHAPKAYKVRACGCDRKGCRPGRPLCHAMRAMSKRPRCYCDGYHYPHRTGSKLCSANPDADRLRFEATSGLSWETGLPLV
jgi:hypothetical protein